MSRKILTAVFLLLAAALVASPQTNTFCANNLACTVSALWNFSGGLQSGGVAVLTNPANLGTQVTGTLAGANYAAVNLAAGNVNGGVTGVLPGANMAATNLAGGNNPGGVTGTLPNANLNTQGTDTNLLTSGTVSASTGVPLCTDANHGATTSGCAASGVSEASIGWSDDSVACATASTGTISATSVCTQRWHWANAHTLTRFRAVASNSAGCSTVTVLSVKDLSTPSILTSLTFVNGTLTYDSGAISVGTTAGHDFAMGVTTQSIGCSTIPNLKQMDVTFQ